MATQKITTQDFKEKIFDYEKEQERKYKGQLPAISDLCRLVWACKMVAPLLEELSKEYEGQL